MSKRYLAVDWGKSKVGLASGDTVTGLAFALEVVPTAQAVQRISEIVRGEQVDKLLIGRPQSELFGTDDGAFAEFVGSLKKQNPDISIIFKDEMFTTAVARRNLREAGKSSRRHRDDAESARVLLQDHLDKERNGNGGKFE